MARDSQTGELGVAVDGAGRIGGRAQHQNSSARGQMPAEIVGGEPPAGRAGIDRHDAGAGHLGLLGVADPVRRGQQHLIAGVAQHLHRDVQRLFGATRNDDLIPGKRYPGHLGGTLGDATTGVASTGDADASTGGSLSGRGAPSIGATPGSCGSLARRGGAG